MTRTALQHQLEEIQGDMLVLGGMVDSAIERSIDALRHRDADLARQVIADDLRLNDKRYETEERCLEIMATQQPMAGDLRAIVAVLYVIVDLERMGDHAEGIAKVALTLADQAPLKSYVRIPRMAEIGREMLRDSLGAFTAHNAAKARAICERDDEVDALYDQVYRQLLDIMIKEPSAVDRATHLTWVAHNLERIADRVTNICERVVYLVEGHIEELNVSKY